MLLLCPFYRWTTESLRDRDDGEYYSRLGHPSSKDWSQNLKLFTVLMWPLEFLTQWPKDHLLWTCLGCILKQIIWPHPRHTKANIRGGWEKRHFNKFPGWWDNQHPGAMDRTVSTKTSYDEVLTPSAMVFRGGALWRWLGLDEAVRMGTLWWNSCPCKKRHKSFPTVSHENTARRWLAVCRTGRGLSPEPHHAGT